MTKTAANKAAEEATEKNAAPEKDEAPARQPGTHKATTSAPERDGSEGKVTDEGSQLQVWNDNVKNQENEANVNAAKDSGGGFDPDFVKTLPVWQQRDPASWGHKAPRG